MESFVFAVSPFNFIAIRGNLPGAPPSLDGLCRWAWYELDDLGREAGFEQDFVDEVVGIGGRRRGFPNDDVASTSSPTPTLPPSTLQDPHLSSRNFGRTLGLTSAAINPSCASSAKRVEKTSISSTPLPTFATQSFSPSVPHSSIKAKSARPSPGYTSLSRYGRPKTGSRTSSYLKLPKSKSVRRPSGRPLWAL